MNEIITDNTVTLITQGEKLGMVGLLLLILLAMGATFVYLIKNIKQSVDELRHSVDKLNAVIEKNTEGNERIFGFLHEQNTKHLSELKNDIGEVLICCKEMRTRCLK